MEKALRYLAETDDTVAEAEGELQASEYLFSLVKDRIFLTSEGTVAERNARAGCANESLEAHQKYIHALIRLKQIKAKRETESQVIGVYRTQEASRRQG
jgi:hypothetical protein